MIFIDVQRIDLNNARAAIDAADAAQGEINAEANPVRRKALIKKHRPKWVAFREHFASLPSGNKCWYTESENPGTDDDIDHFRPKGEVAEDSAHGGYYWQALTWTNFRLSCHRANRPRKDPNTNDLHGKINHFPLFDETARSRTPADDLSHERPMLLDPCDPLDPPELSFNTDGKVAVAPAHESDPMAIQQVETSRKYLHLDWPTFIDNRKELYNRVYFKVKEGVQHEQRAMQNDPASRDSLKSIVAELVDMIREDRPYSSAAKAYLMAHRHVFWVRVAVLRLPPEPAVQPGSGAT